MDKLKPSLKLKISVVDSDRTRHNPPKELKVSLDNPRPLKVSASDKVNLPKATSSKGIQAVCQVALLLLAKLQVNHLQVSLALNHKLLHKRAHFLVEHKPAFKELSKLLTVLSLNQHLAAWAKLKIYNLSLVSSTKISRALALLVTLDNLNKFNNLKAVFLAKDRLLVQLV